MLTSKAWLDRLVKKSSALGIASVLVLSAGSTFAAAPAQAKTLGTKTYTYTCGTGGPFTNTSISVSLQAPDSTTAGGTFDVTVNIPALTIASTSSPPAATTLQATLALTATTGGTISSPGVKDSTTQIAAQATTTTATSVKYAVAVTAGATGKVSLTPGELKLNFKSPATPVTTCTAPTAPEVLDVTIGTGGGGGATTDVVKYNCTNAGDADNDLKVTLTVSPASVKTNEEVTLSWKTENNQSGMELKAPDGGLAANSKVAVNIDGGTAVGLTPVKGEQTLTTAFTADQIIAFPADLITWKAKATTAGTANLKPGALTITPPGGTAISCTVDTTQTNLKTYPLTVTTGSASPSASTTASNTPNPTTTRTVVVTKTPVGGGGGVTKTPKAGAETGGGGELGPDGRMFVLTGSVMIAAAGVGGLMMRRRRTLRG